MYPATMQKIGAEQGREMREQATAWRRTREARRAARARSTRISFARNGRSRAGQKRLHGPAAV